MGIFADLPSLRPGMPLVSFLLRPSAVGQCRSNAIRTFNERGVGALEEGSSRPKTIHKKLDEEGAECLKGLLHRSPRDFGRDTGVWTLDLAADVSFEQGLTEERVSDETVRQALKRLGVGWKRAKRWISSPDPEYTRKKGSATG